jgi:hypothetical protein
MGPIVETPPSREVLQLQGVVELADAAQQPLISSGKKAILLQLGKSTESIDVDEKPLATTLADVASSAHLILNINWKALETAGVDRNTPVTLHAKNIPAGTLLQLILDHAGGGVATMAYHVGDREIAVTTRDQLYTPEFCVTRTYDIGFATADLDPESQEAMNIAMNIRDTIVATIEPSTWMDNGGRIGTARVVGSCLVVKQQDDLQIQIAEMIETVKRRMIRETRAYDVQDLVKKDDAPGANAQEITASLINTIETSCGRDTWRDRGGKSSSVAFFQGKLYITANSAVQEQVEKLLAMMRK